ncbi:unnamed protein product [Oikopleura dioica]|uniref:Uncharacterized protein n=1 Tax=Oikopleura dioica TaxID=34765 RepID=E4WPW9_OIKDI|nr:unnamed protein product [Oikopleura dioica]
MKKRKHVISLILSPMFTKNIGAQNIITNKLSLFKTRNKCSKIRCHKQRNISTPNTIRVGCFEGDWREMWFVPNGVGWVPQLNASVDYPVCKDMKSTSDEIEERIFKNDSKISILLYKSH